MELFNSFSRVVEQQPEAIALYSEMEGSMTYKDLLAHAQGVAAFLIDYLDKSVGLVGVCIHRSFNLIEAIMGILASGRAYVPLDPGYPVEWLSGIVKDAGLQFIICDDRSITTFSDMQCTVANINTILDYAYEKIYPNDVTELAYVLYTSGSTGRAKGVMISESSIMNSINWQIEYYRLSNSDVVLQIPSISFDSSVTDIFSTLLSGGAVLVVGSQDIFSPRKIAALINKYTVTHFFMVPNLYMETIKELRGTKSLRYIIIAGQGFTEKLIKRHFDCIPQVQLYNEYGLTETSVVCSVHQVCAGEVPNNIGKPIKNMSLMLYQQDQDGVGEIVVGGLGIANGYLNNLNKGKDAFVEIDGSRCFITGDFAYKDVTGDLIYIGRKDSQIKINGQRIDLSIIDATIQQEIGVSSAFSSVINLGNKRKIILFIETKQENTSSYYRKYLYGKLPPAYIPDFIVVKSHFQMLPNTKTDKVTLVNEFLNDYKSADAFINPIISQIMQFISESSEIPLDIIDIESDLREVGLNSIDIVSLIILIEEEYGIEMDYSDLVRMEVLSVNKLAAYVEMKTI